MARSEIRSYPSAIGFWKWDIANDRVYGDLNLSEFFNVPPQRALDGIGIEPCLEAIVEDDRQRVVTAIGCSVQERSLFRQSYRVQTASRGIRTILACGRCWADENGNPLHPGWFADVTEKTGLEVLHDTERCDELVRGIARENLHLAAYLQDNVFVEIENALPGKANLQR